MSEEITPTEVPEAPDATTVVEPQSVEDLPEWTQKLIRDTRKEAADHRAAAKTSADAAQREFADKIAKALGLKDDAPDVDSLTASLSQAQRDARDKSIELAVYKAASQHEGNPDALLDSRTFLASVTNLDPSSDDFVSSVGGAIKAAVDANPNLKAVTANGDTSAPAPGGYRVADPAQAAPSTPDEQAVKEAFARQLFQLDK